MGLFSNLKTDGLEESQDRLGGYQVFPTDAYKATVKMAYAGSAASGAMFVALTLALEGGKEYNQTIYITNKKGENFFLNPQDQSKKVPLPGFTLIDDLCLVTTEKPLSDQTTEEKVIKIYDYDSKKDVPTNVPVLVDLLGKEAIFGIINVLENKSVKSDATGEYEPTADTREINDIEKIFHAEMKITVVEAKQGATQPAFYEAWVAKNKGVQRDKRKIKDGQGGSGQVKSGKPGSNNAPTSGGETKASTKPLFGK